MCEYFIFLFCLVFKIVTTLTEEKRVNKQVQNPCDSAISGMRKLNKSLESIVEVGQDVDKIAESWHRSNETLVSSTTAELKIDTNAIK